MRSLDRGTAQARLAGALLGTCMLLLVHRYWGIDHDATLYLGHALAQHWPETFGNDLYFMHGSQGRYTLFPLITGWLVGMFDPIATFFWGGLIGLLLFAMASWFSLRALLPEGRRYWAWLCVLVLPSFYGRAIIFSYAEPFLTPRPFAEGLCLAAIGLLARQRLSGAALCLLLAMLLHPLQVIAAALVIWPWLVNRDRRWLHTLWLALPIAAAGLAGTEPLAGLFIPLDAEWLAQLRAINGQLFVTGWAMADYRIVAFDALLLAFASRTADHAFGAWCRAAMAGLGMGIAASLLLVDVLHLTLPAALQLWRVHWLAHWFAMAGLAWLMARHAWHRDWARVALLALTSLLAWGPSDWLWLPFAGLYAGWPLVERHLRTQLRIVVAGLCGAGIAILASTHVVNEIANFRRAGYRLDLYALDQRLLAYPLVALGLPLVALTIWRGATSRMRPALALFVLFPICAIALMRWDITSQTRVALDANANMPTLFGAAIPEDAQVYWDNMSLLGTWSVLRRADYYDPQQLSGLVFNRGTVDDASIRIARMEPLIVESIGCQQAALPSTNPTAACRISDAAMRQACAASPLPKPDYLVLPYRQPQPSLGSWTMEDHASGKPIATYWLYRCTDVIAGDIHAGTVGTWPAFPTPRE